jgi:L-fuconolactonase
MATPTPGAMEMLDSHCHAWRRWPYPPLVPDEDSRGTIHQLLYEMDANGVAAATVVCAAIENNPDNVAYVAFARDRYPDRIYILADLDCAWSDSYHQPGSADRLRQVHDSFAVTGFTHYTSRENDGWFLSEEANEVFAVAAERNLLASIAAFPSWQDDLRLLASRHPSVPVLCHHLGVVSAADGLDSPPLRNVIASAAVPNILIKVSGFYYSSAVGWNFPWRDAVDVFRRLFDAFGPDRMCWGSDFPASDRYCTYRQAIEVVRSKCEFLSDEDRQRVLGATLRSVLRTGHPVGIEVVP